MQINIQVAEFDGNSFAAWCHPLSSPSNGEVTLTGLTSGSTATYTCDNGYQLTADKTRTCLNTGMWSGQEPTCKCIKKSILKYTMLSYKQQRIYLAYQHAFSLIMLWNA